MAVIETNTLVQAGEQIDRLQENRAIAQQLTEIANLLRDQHANEFRIRAYQAAATTIAELPSPVRELLDHEGT
ncbi:MAG: helix-hairpin-helix domain-containing protein, partial [Rhodopirellula bahusiensis]